MGICFRHNALKPKLKTFRHNALKPKLKKIDERFAYLIKSDSKFLAKKRKKRFGVKKQKFNILHSDSRALKLIINNRIHLGHKTNKWDPKMKPFLQVKSLKPIVGTKKPVNSHVLDPLKTLSHLNYLSVCLSKTISTGKKMLFVGTKNQYKRLISKAANLCKSYFITEKWLGGMLTNWQTVRTLTVLLRKYDLLIARGVIQGMYKKEAARAYKEKNRLSRLLEGVKYMIRKPDLVVVMGQLSEVTVLDECKKIYIPSICLVDSNCSPRISNIVLPTNDDSTRALNPLFEMVINSVKRGRLLFLDNNKPKVYKRRYKNKPKIKYIPRLIRRQQNIEAVNRIKKLQKLKKFKMTNNKTNQDESQSSKKKENQLLKLSKGKKIKSIESVPKDSSVLPKEFPDFANDKNLSRLPDDFSVLPKQLPKKKLHIQDLWNNETQINSALNEAKQSQENFKNDLNSKKANDHKAVPKEKQKVKTMQNETN